VKGYDELCRAVAFLRWHQEDADDFTRSLFAGRGGRRKAEPTTDGPVPAATPTATLTPPASPATPAPPKAAANAIRQGLPGANPFMD
jgi:hypothetical protein